MGNQKPSEKVLDEIIKRSRYHIAQMIYLANHRPEAEKGDPKVGGHASASTSALHILSALHLMVKSGFDHICNKPHASPADHSLNYLMDLFLKDDFSRMPIDECNIAMQGLRKYSLEGEPVFQSYHSAYDPDRHNFLPSGTVGIPPVNSGYLALAYRFAKQQGYNVPDAHFWCLIGDSEFREGSLLEAAPDFAEREIGNLTWIIDYNRQSLDGNRITNKEIMGGTDADRIERTMAANGWEVIQLRHGRKRQELFKKPDGDVFKKFLEEDLEDFEFQALLLVQDMPALKKGLKEHHPQLKKFIESVSDDELFYGFRDVAGHDVYAIAEALEQSKKNTRKPTVIVAHTIKGYGLNMAATPGNHGALPSKEEVEALRESEGLSANTLFSRIDESSEAGQFLRQRGDQLYSEILEQEKIRQSNQKTFEDKLNEFGPQPDTLDINLKMANYPHTQWMFGQLNAKLSRIANTPLDESQLAEKQRPLTEAEKPWKTPGELLMQMAPDVGTTTNLNPSMDGKVFGAPVVEDFETEFNVKNAKLPDLVPGDEAEDRFFRFEIAESNVMSCMGSFGRIRDVLGIPIIPLMTVYDFFIKRALDQYFYDLYWKSSFILIGTPSGVTLSPEGAQHGWKSDIQVPNQITWEPTYCQEFDWILCDSVNRHLRYDNDGRTGVLIRGVTKGLDQKNFLKNLKTQKRFKTNIEEGHYLHHKDFPLGGAVSEADFSTLEESEIMEVIKSDVLNGGYYLINYEGYAGYEPGDNVVHIFAMGALVEEAVKASNDLLERGIYANVIAVTSPDLLVGTLGLESDYHHLKNNLGVNANLFIQPTATEDSGDLVSVAGRRVPIVSVHDGEPGLLDNIGSIIGVKHESLAVRKHSKCGRPSEIYGFHGIDADSIVHASGKVLSETALEKTQVSRKVLMGTNDVPEPPEDWRQFWPQTH